MSVDDDNLHWHEHSCDWPLLCTCEPSHQAWLRDRAALAADQKRLDADIRRAYQRRVTFVKTPPPRPDDNHHWCEEHGAWMVACNHMPELIASTYVGPTPTIKLGPDERYPGLRMPRRKIYRFQRWDPETIGLFTMVGWVNAALMTLAGAMAAWAVPTTGEAIAFMGGWTCVTYGFGLLAWFVTHRLDE